MMERKRLWRIMEKRRETPEAETLVLEPAGGGEVAYAPGQYLSVIRDGPEGERRRAYSFSSCPVVDARAAITVKRIPNGEFSNWLTRQVEPGDQIWAAGPSGQFRLPEKAPRRLVYLAAGSGIAPVFSHLKELFLTRRFEAAPVLLFYANRDSVHTIFKAALDHWAAIFPDRFRCTYFFSRERDAPNAHYGHLSHARFEHALLQHLGNPPGRALRAGTQVYLCAPPARMRMARMTLRTLDFPEENIHTETYLPEARLRLRPIDPAKTHRIIATGGDGQRLEFEVFSGETVLNGALRQGIALPYTCKSGVCFTCLARCRHGEVDLQMVGQVRRESAGTIINTCISYPVSPEVEIEYDP